jgi:hypothetical protein
MAGAGVAALLVGTLVLMAGCASSDAATPNAAPAPAPATVRANPEALVDGGSIRGTVTDDSLLPIPNAQVALLQTEVRAMSDEAGTFEITNLAPGDYQVAAAALGYSSVVKRVVVNPSAETAVSLVLTSVAIAKEYVEIIGPFAFYFDVRVGTPALTGGSGPNDRASQNFTMTEDAVDFVGELTWQQGSFATSKALRMSFSYQGRPTTHWFCTATSPSPLQWRYNLPDAVNGSPSDGCKESAYCGTGASQGLSGQHAYPTVDHNLITYVNTPFGCTSDPTHIVELALQQRLTGMLTISHGGGLPPDYTAFPDA